MKQTIVLIATIALLGLLGVFYKTNSPNQLITPNASSVSNNSSASSPSNAQSSTMMNNMQNHMSYKSGTFSGSNEFTPYGNVQISVVISGGKITDVNFLQMPNDQRESLRRTQISEPLLKQTTISKQSSNIDFVSGATSTSEAYQQSLQSALDQAAQA